MSEATTETVPTPPALVLLGIVCIDSATPGFFTGYSDWLSVSAWPLGESDARPDPSVTHVAGVYVDGRASAYGHGRSYEEAAEAALLELLSAHDAVWRHHAALKIGRAHV